MEYESIEGIPGLDEIRGRAGTDVVVLAGAAKFWHDKYKSARKDGFLGGLALGGFAVIAFEIVRSFL